MRKEFLAETLRISDHSAFEGHGAALLLLIREKRVTSWGSLCQVFRFDPHGNHSGHFALRRTLQRLVAAGFVEANETLRGRYRVTEKVEELHGALGVSLVEAANLTLYEGMAVRPIFGARPDTQRSAHVFVLMPFADTFAPVYKAIRSAARRLGFSVQRADELSSARPVMDDIWASICNAGVIVADCTGRNANVFYEIGIAHTVGREVVLLSQKKEDVPFDIAHLRYIEYAQTASGLTKLGRQLQKTLGAVRAAGWTP